MSAPKILVFGTNGQVGWNLRRTLSTLGKVIAVDYPEIDFSSPDSIRSCIRSLTPAVIVNAAAYTAVDEAETSSDVATAVNATAPAVIAEEANRHASIVVHYSTDYVFDGSKSSSYTETDEPNPLSAYGRSKLAGDQAIQSIARDYLIFRTSWVYGARGKNFLLTMLRLAQERSELRVVDDQIGAPTSSEFIAQSTATTLAQVLTPASPNRLDGRSGVYNLTNSGETSWYGFAQAMLTKAAPLLHTPVPKLIPIPASEYKLPAKRPANSRLCTNKVTGTFGICPPSWQDSLSLVIDALAQPGFTVAQTAAR